MLIQKGAGERIMFFMSDETDNETGETSLTVTITVSKNGGAFNTATNAAVEVAGGWYYVDLTATETNTAGPLVITCDATGANSWLDIHQVYGDNFLSDVDVARVADIILRRDLTNVETSSNGDALAVDSLLGVALLSLNSSVSGTTVTINKTDTTALGTFTITVDGSGDWTGKSL